MAAAEQKKSYEVVKNFRGVNTKANRTAIGDDEFFWLENAMPVGYANLKITPTFDNVGSITFSNTVVNFFSANIGLDDYLIAFQSNGSCEYVNLTTNVKGTLASASTFSTSGMNVSQWKNERLLIIDPTKGYFTWDGTNLISVGSVGSIGLVSGGTGSNTAAGVRTNLSLGSLATLSSITSTQFAATTTLLILDSAGSTLKTIRSPSS